MAKSRDHKREKTYSAPKLIIYGRIAELTNTVGNMQAPDNGTPPMQKTAV